MSLKIICNSALTTVNPYLPLPRVVHCVRFLRNQVAEHKQGLIFKLIIQVNDMDINDEQKQKRPNTDKVTSGSGTKNHCETVQSADVCTIQNKLSDKRENGPRDDFKIWSEIMDQNLGQANYPNLKMFRNRPLTDATAVFRHNAWDDVEWDDEMQSAAVASVQKNSMTLVQQSEQDDYEQKAGFLWDKFYGIHQNKFFRDRNWLFIEFPELESPYGSSVEEEFSQMEIDKKRINESFPGENSKFKIMEIGCGAGNTVFPLLAANNNPETYMYACDFSSSAVEIVKNHSKFEKNRCSAFVFDATAVNPAVPFPAGSLDVITVIFVISAINPTKFDQVLQNIYSFLKPGGIVLFRDYGRYDMAQLRFKDGRCLSDNFYVRGDGTRVYFFTEEEVEDLFQRNKFVKEKLLVDRRLQVNRGKQLKMYRVWVQAKFKKPL